jgi:hypothetical protein
MIARDGGWIMIIGRRKSLQKSKAHHPFRLAVKERASQFLDAHI